MAIVNFSEGHPAVIMVEYTNTKPPADADADISQPALMRGVVCLFPKALPMIC